MSMIHSPTIMPPPKDRSSDLIRENETLKIQVGELKTALFRERERIGQLEHGLSGLRTSLTPLYQALQQIFGDFEGLDIRAEESAKPQVSAVWDSWKTKLGGKTAEAIDILMLHRSLTAGQLRLHLHCATDYVYQVISKLNVNGLINKQGGKISLKEL